MDVYITSFHEITQVCNITELTLAISNKNLKALAVLSRKQKRHKMDLQH